MPTVNPGRYYNSNTAPYKVFIDEEKKFNVITLGTGSYGESFVESGDVDKLIHVLVGRYTSIGEQTTFLSATNGGYNHVSNYPFGKIFRQPDALLHRQIIIGNDVRIGRRCTIFGGVKIGNGAIIKDDSVVREDVPPYAVVAGNPAKVIQRRFTADIIYKLQKIKWWYWDKATIEERLPLMDDAEKFSAQFNVPDFQIPQINQLVELKRAGFKIYFIVADFNVPNSVWDNVVSQYIRDYSAIEKSFLIVGCLDSADSRKIFSRIDELRLKAGLSEVKIILINLDENFYLGIMPNIDVFISNREDLSSVCVDYAENFDKEVISGLDDKIFYPPPKKISIREKLPLLTIGIPTYNRSKHLRKLLAHLCPAVGNDPRVEICISDNDSPDDTKDVVKPYLETYDNVRYHKNDENIGGDNNIFQIYRTARGKFVIAHGDDDGVVNDVWAKVLNVISQDESCGVIGLLNVEDIGYNIIHGTKISEYMDTMSYWTTWISRILLNHSAVFELNQPDKCINLNFNQLYLQLEILKNHPNFYIVTGRITQPNFFGEGPGSYNYMKVFIKNYLDILNDYAGLTCEEMSKQKLKIFREHIVKYFTLSKAGDVNISVENGEKIFAEYYKDEPYYKQAVEYLMKIDASTAGKRWSKYL